MNIAYVHTNFWFGLKGGGCITHTNGVVNAMDDLEHNVVFIGPHQIPGVRKSVPFELLPASPVKIHGFVDQYRYNISSIKPLVRLLKKHKVDIVYHRAHGRSFAVRRAAATAGVPLVLEYNSSEVWMGKWLPRGRIPIVRDIEAYLKQRAIAANEIANLNKATSIVVISSVMKSLLLEHDIPSEKILVNPNGIDKNRFAGLNSRRVTEIQNSLNLSGKTVAGFVGTFWQWHGIPQMVEMIKTLIDRHGPDAFAFLFIGEGEMKSVAEEELKGTPSVHFLGSIPYEDVPHYLLACDILLSPHVPNRDGTTFFGSPTKLFEYMGAGKAIVASDLEQIGEVLEHEKTALLTKPGDVQGLVESVERLHGSPELGAELGENARREALEKYTWDAHVQRIIEFTEERIRSK